MKITADSDKLIKLFISKYDVIAANLNLYPYYIEVQFLQGPLTRKKLCNRLL
jgi:hypothetical protein